MSSLAWVPVQAKLRACTAFFACMAALNAITAVDEWEYGLAAVLFAFFACVVWGLRHAAIHRRPLLVGIGTFVIGSTAIIIALGQFFGSGIFFLLSPLLALLSDSPNTAGHIKLFTIWLVAGIWFVSALLGGRAAWQLFSIVDSLPINEDSS